MTTKDQYAIWKPSPNFWPGRMGYKPRFIIIHSSGGGGSVSWLTDTVSQVSANYDVLQDGTTYQLVDEECSAWANGVLSEGHDSWWSNDTNPNLITISIEHEKPDQTNQMALTAAQALASFQLISRICQRWNIPARAADANGGITGHYSIDPKGRPDCPGTYPFDGLFTYLKQIHGDVTNMLAITDPMGMFFTDAGNNRWNVKNSNVSLAYAHLDFYRKHEGAFGIPLTDEIYLAQLPGASIVIYERGIAIYDPQAKYGPPPGAGQVYLMSINQGIAQQIIAKPLVTALQAQITTMQAQIADLENKANVTDLQAKIASYESALTQIGHIYTQMLGYSLQKL